MSKIKKYCPICKTTEIAKFQLYCSPCHMNKFPPEVVFKPKVTLKVESETCANCKFFVAERFCYLRPPVLSPTDGGSMRPRTEADDFCAEFVRIKS